MTLKEKVAEIQPDCIDDNYEADGVKRCPSDYDYLNKPGLYFNSCECKHYTNCCECWNQPFLDKSVDKSDNTEQVNHPEQEEVWKPIENFALYEVSSIGRIRNKETGYIKNPGIGKRGYPVVSLRANGKMYLRTVHTIFARAFIPNPENKPYINHINGIKTDYSIENLEWVTSRENCIHARITGLHVSDGDKAVKQYEKNGRFVAMYRSASEASRQTGIGRANICNACHLRKYNGKTSRTAGGYVWKWA